MRTSRRIGLRPGAGARRKRMPGESAAVASTMAAHPLLRLQRTIGNRAVQRLLARRESAELQREAAPKTEAPPSAFITIVFEKGGEVRSKSKHPGYEGKFPILAISHRDVPRPSSSRERRGEDEPKQPASIEIVRHADELTQPLMQAAAKGLRITSIRLEFVKAGEDGKLQTVQELQFIDGLVTGLQIVGGEPPVETIGLEFMNQDFKPPPDTESRDEK